MTWDNGLSEQLYAAAYAAGMGALFAVIYDCFRLIRLRFDKKWLELLLDSIFSVTFVTMFFLLVTSVAQTKLRGFLLLACAGGWLLWNRTGGYLLCSHRSHTAFERNPRKNKK